MNRLTISELAYQLDLLSLTPDEIIKEEYIEYKGSSDVPVSLEAFEALQYLAIQEGKQEFISSLLAMAQVILETGNAPTNIQ